MTTTVAIDVTKDPYTLTVVSDRHIETITATVGGETATGSIAFPVTIADSAGRVWTQASDDKGAPKSTIVFTSPK